MEENKYEQTLEKTLKENNVVLIYKDIDKVSEEEFAYIRHSGFGASDSSRLLDINPFSSRQELINEKVSYKTDDSISKKASVRMGKDLEPFILNWAQEVFRTVFDNQKIIIYKPKNMYGEKETHLNINYDGVMFNTPENIDTVTEAKAVTKYGKKYYNFDNAYCHTKDGKAVLETNILKEPTVPHITEINYVDVCHQLADYYGIPIYYFTQVQQQIMPLKTGYGYLVVLDVDEWELYIFRIYRHQEIIDLLRKRGIKDGALIEARRKVISNRLSEKTNDELPTK